MAVAERARGARGRARGRPRGGRAPRRRAARLRAARAQIQRGCAAAPRPSPAPRSAPSRRATTPQRGRRGLGELAERLGLDAEPAAEPLPEGERDDARRRGSSACSAAASSSGRSTRSPRTSTPRRSPTSRSSRPSARTSRTRCASCKGLIRDTDRRIREAFEETFTAAAQELRGGRRAALPRRPRPPAARARGRRPAPGARRRRARRGRRPSDEERARGRRGGRGERRPRRRPGRRDRDHARRQVDQAPDAALRRREVADRARLPVRGLPRPAVPVLHPRRGRGRARRPQHRPLPHASCAASPTARSSSSSPTRSARWRPPTPSTACRWRGNGVSKVVSRRLPPRIAA